MESEKDNAMETDLLASENKIRARRFRETALALESAAKAYKQAADALADEDEQGSNAAYKRAQQVLEAIVDELPKPIPKQLAIRAEEKPKYEWGWLKYMVPVGVVLIILYFMVTGGFSGDLSKTWDTSRDIRDAVRYPKNPQ